MADNPNIELAIDRCTALLGHAWLAVITADSDDRIVGKEIWLRRPSNEEVIAAARRLVPPGTGNVTVDLNSLDIFMEV